MANEVGAAYYTLDLDDKGFKKKIDNAHAELGGLDASFKRAEKGSQMFANGLLAIGAAGVAAAGFGVKIAGDLESARQGFVALLGSAEEADATMARVKKEAAATPFELTGLVAGTQALTAITKDGNKAVDILLDVGKAIATSGKGQAELDRVVLNLQQISSTGKVTAMDIRQFQSAIPMFNDIIEAAGLTTEELLNSETAAEDLFVAFEKAGKEGGLTAAGFEAQAGTFNQLWSNLVDSITIGASELVEKLGIFDMVKEGLGKINEALSNITSPEGIEQIKNILQGVADNAPIVAGIILGALAPAFYALAAGVWAAMAPLIPFIAAGAAIGLAVKLVVDALGGWEAAQEKVNGVLDMLKEVYNTWIKPALEDLFKIIRDELLPNLQRLWEVVGPILLPILQALATVAGVIVVAGIRIVIEVLKVLIGWVSDSIAAFTDIVQFFRDLPGKISNALSGLKNAIVKPFEDAWNRVKEIAQGIWDSLQKINPFHRESPSLVDNVQKGVEVINRAFDKLSADITPVAHLSAEPALAGIQGGNGLGMQNVTINIDKVGSQQDVDAIGRELAFRTGLSPQMFEA